MKYLTLILIISTYAYTSTGQPCNSNATEKYEKIMCEIEGLIAETYDKVQDDFGPNPIREKLRKMNNENCDKLFKLRDELKSELYKQNELDYNLTNHIEVYLTSVKVYINSLKVLTEGNQFDVYLIAENSRAYQLMEISKLNLINLLWEKKRALNVGSTVINWLQDSLVKFHIATSFGFYNSSLKTQLEKNIDTSLNDLSFKKLNYNFSAEYDISKKFRIGFGINSIPETGTNTFIANDTFVYIGRLEERIRGTTLNIYGTYFIIPNKNRSSFGIEAGFSLGVAGSFISSQRTINTSTYSVVTTNYFSSSTTTYTIISNDQETYTGHTTSLGLTIGAGVDIYFNKHISLRAAASAMFNTDILIPRQYYNISEVLEEQNLSFSAFTYILGIAIHL